MERTSRVVIHPPRRHDDLCGLSLCAGVAGLDLGLHLAEPRYRAVGYVERNSFAAAALVARMADQALAPAPVWDDLRSFDGHPWRGRVHILSAGYPCQPFSLAGNRKGEDDPRHLWPEVARIIGEVVPEWCFFENVPGHLSLGFQDVARDLQGMGYRVAATVVSAAEVGGSHLRERMFILAHTDVQKFGQSGVFPGDGLRPEASEGRGPGGQAAGPAERRVKLDSPVGLDDVAGLDPALPGVFPPLPGAFEAWGLALAARPQLKPGLHRLDDGLASWLDRSAAAGNGVVPMAAARAWRFLRAEMGV